jgi:transmembrane sensor
VTGGPINHLFEHAEDQAVDWCLRLAEAPLDPASQREFDAWLQGEGNRELFDQAALVWESADGASGSPEGIAARSEALEAARLAGISRFNRPSGPRRYWIAGIAAAIVLLVMSSFMMMRDAAQVYETKVGERRIVMLDDGSRLSLDAATRIEVRLDDDRRALTLVTGRAKFDVAKDALRPFSVNAGDKVVVATGTSFSVERLRSEIRVLLYEGRVDVLEKADGKDRATPIRAASGDKQLLPGRELVASIARPDVAVAEADVSRSLAWESGQLNFINEPVRSAVERMNRYSSTRIRVADGVAEVRVNGVYNAGDTEAFIEGIAGFTSLKALRGNGEIILIRDSD